MSACFSFLSKMDEEGGGFVLFLCLSQSNTIIHVWRKTSWVN